MATRPPLGSQRIGELQARQQREEFRLALRVLLMQPLMSPSHDDFPAVRRQSEALREWFARELGWALHVERDGARLYKRPADLLDPTRGLEGFDRRRYVLLCLACAALERAEPQITLHVLGERIMELAAEPTLSARGFDFTLRSATERRELVGVCRALMGLGVLQRIAGDEDGFVQGQVARAQADALYDIQRRLLAGMLAAVRGPSTWSPADAPVTLDERLHALVTEHVADSDEGRRGAQRHALARRLLDDPVVYSGTLEPDVLAYFSNQRGAMAARLCEATGLTSEHRAEGSALTDENGSLTDVPMPAEGTEAHVTLLVAEHLAARARRHGLGSAAAATTDEAVAAFVRGATERFGRFWRKSAREPGAEHELAQTALARLRQLQLIERDAGQVHALPAIARFAISTAKTKPSAVRTPVTSGSLF